MSRVIKFRAWDGRKMHFDGPLLKVTGNALMLLDPHIKDDRWIDLKKDCIFMQFTGLHDKNGKEIYEGDIVMCYDWGYYKEESNRTVICVSTVEWCKGEAAWTLSPDPTDGDRYDLFRILDVIGNIHENPELL